MMMLTRGGWSNYFSNKITSDGSEFHIYVILFINWYIDRALNLRRDFLTIDYFDNLDNKILNKYKQIIKKIRDIYFYL
jgi:hypothetical protein